MDRIKLIQEIFQRTNFQNYLEIGCQSGVSFLPIKAKYKTAVDPIFRISNKKKLKWLIKEPKNYYNKYFEEESDVFFSKRNAYFEKVGQFDVVLVDGLHIFRASLNDVLNSLKYLNNNGIIIMHDCYPPHKAAALPTRIFLSEAEQKEVEGWTSEWCGDVWKTIVYLRKKLHELLNVYVINTDYGLGIVRPKRKIDEKQLTIDEKLFSEIDRLTYEELLQNAKSMLNLKESEYTMTIIDEITAHNKK